MSVRATVRGTAAWRPSQFLSVLDLTPGELETCLDLAASMKTARHAGRAHGTPLTGRHVAMLFDKPSLRTRSTFIIAVRELGGDGMEPRAAAQLGRESVARVARFGRGVHVTNDPVDAVARAGAVYTDVWASMGQETEAAARDDVFRPYQVNAALMAQAPRGAVFMHCLPAHRGDEVTDEVMDSPASIVFDQSENRLHAQKALLALLSS